MIDKALKEVQDCRVTYINDILVLSTRNEHLAHLHLVFQALHKAGLTANQKKSHLSHISIQYLGFNIGQGRIWAVKDKVEVLAKAALLQMCKELKGFLGLASYYCCFVPHFATLAALLTDLLEGGGKRWKPIVLGSVALEAFG